MKFCKVFVYKKLKHYSFSRKERSSENLKYSQKKNRYENSVDIIGRFGEGMKLSALSLIRENKDRNKQDNETQLNIYTCGKIWRFKIQKAEGFTRNGIEQLCLHWCCEDYPKDEYKDKVICEIIGISENDWKIEQDNYLWLTHRRTGSIVCCDDNKKVVGEVLCNEFFLRKIYVKEVFINYTGNETKEKNQSNKENEKNDIIESNKENV